MNGIGGHIEEGETPLQAQVREFKEETGLQVSNWAEVIAFGNEHFELTVFKAFAVRLQDMESITDEKVEIFEACNLPDNVIFNLRWLIPLALDMEMPYFSLKGEGKWR